MCSEKVYSATAPHIKFIHCDCLLALLMGSDSLLDGQQIFIHSFRSEPEQTHSIYIIFLFEFTQRSRPRRTHAIFIISKSVSEYFFFSFPTLLSTPLRLMRYKTYSGMYFLAAEKITQTHTRTTLFYNH